MIFGEKKTVELNIMSKNCTLIKCKFQLCFGLIGYYSNETALFTLVLKFKNYLF